MDHNIELIKNKINNAEVLFFDLDGTLIDTEPLYYRFWKEASKCCGYELTHEEALNMRSLDKTFAMEYLSKVSNDILKYDEVKAKRIELMSEYLSTHPIKFKESALKILNKYHNDGKKIYIVTANTIEKAQRIINGLGFMHLLSGIISAKDVKRGKPFPDVYISASKQVNKNPSEIVVFEDSPNGLKSSFDARCFTVMVEDLTPYTSDMNYVDGAISSFNKLLK